MCDPLRGEGARTPMNHSLLHKYHTRDVGSYPAISQGRDYKELEHPSILLQLR